MTMDDFTTAAIAEGKQMYPMSERQAGKTLTGLSRAAHYAGAVWARDHLAAQPVTHRPAALALYLRRADYHTPESWDREPASVKLPYLLDASAALTAAKEATR